MEYINIIDSKIGIINLKASCFIKSLIQILIHCKSFMDEFFKILIFMLTIIIVFLIKFLEIVKICYQQKLKSIIVLIYHTFIIFFQLNMRVVVGRLSKIAMNSYYFYWMI